MKMNAIKIRENVESFMTKGLGLPCESKGAIVTTQEPVRDRGGLSDKIALFTFLTEQGFQVVNLGDIGGQGETLWDVLLPDGAYLMSIKWTKPARAI